MLWYHETIKKRTLVEWFVHLVTICKWFATLTRQCCLGTLNFISDYYGETR